MISQIFRKNDKLLSEIKDTRKQLHAGLITSQQAHRKFIEDTSKRVPIAGGEFHFTEREKDRLRDLYAQKKENEPISETIKRVEKQREWELLQKKMAEDSRRDQEMYRQVKQDEPRPSSSSDNVFSFRR